MSRKPVWAVVEGDYSDYRVHVLFTSEALAKAHVKAGGGDSVEEFVLYDKPPRRVAVYSIDARIWPDGQVTAETREPSGAPTMRREVEWEYGEFWGPAKPIREARILQAPYSGKDWLVRVSGTDKQRVQKAFDDRVAEALARTLGVA